MKLNHRLNQHLLLSLVLILSSCDAVQVTNSHHQSNKKNLNSDQTSDVSTTNETNTNDAQNSSAIDGTMTPQDENEIDQNSTDDATDPNSGPDPANQDLSTPLPTNGENLFFATDFEQGLSDLINSSDVSIDTDIFYSGSASLKISGNATILLKDFLPIASNKLYLRTYFRMNQVTPPGHDTMIKFGTADGFYEGDMVRFGALHDVLQIDYFGEIGSNGEIIDVAWPVVMQNGVNQFNSPVFTDVTNEADKWYCLEMLYDKEIPEVRLWLDEKPQLILQPDAPAEMLKYFGWDESNHTTWGRDITTIRFGWTSIGGPIEGFAIWYDDFAISTEKIGCK